MQSIDCRMHSVWSRARPGYFGMCSIPCLCSASYIILQHVTKCCNTLQHAATYIPFHISQPRLWSAHDVAINHGKHFLELIRLQVGSMSHVSLQHAATCCNALQHNRPALPWDRPTTSMNESYHEYHVTPHIWRSCVMSHIWRSHVTSRIRRSRITSKTWRSHVTSNI